MNTRYFSVLLLGTLGAYTPAVGCDASATSGSPAGDGGGAQQPFDSASNNANDAAGVDDGSAGGRIDSSGTANADGADSGGTASPGVMGGAMGSDGGSAVVVGSNDGGTDAGGTACERAAAVDRTCMADADCISVTHQTDYIGQVRLLGIRSSEMAHFAALEMSCHATMKTFSLPAVIADDGSLVGAATRAVSCAAGLCTTFSPACGHPCSSGHICITCGTGATVSSVCSQDCSMGSCTEAPRTSCLGGTDVNGGEGEFCFDPVFAAGFMSTSCHR